MSYDLAIGSDSRPLQNSPRSLRRESGSFALASASAFVCAVAAIVLGLGACSGQETGDMERPILKTRTGETGIEVVQAEEGGAQIIRVTTTFRGEKSTVAMLIDEAVYDIEIPLSIQQQKPAQTGGGGGGGGGDGAGGFSDLLAAQYLEKAQERMLEGDYIAALRQVNMVLTVRPDSVEALMMKGSVYYAMGNYQMANEQWEQVLVLDPSNEEVRQFQDFLKSQHDIGQPNLPGVQPDSAPKPPAEAKPKNGSPAEGNKQ